MISIRQSDAIAPNKSLEYTPAKPNEGNAAWLKRVGATDGVIMFGGASPAHFRIRIAQTHARSDMKPSFWSVAGILLDNQSFLSVPLEHWPETSEVAKNNGVQTCLMSDYDDPERYPNIVVVRFTSDHERVLKSALLVGGDPKRRRPAQRSIIDLPTLILPWLAFIWMAGEASNPLTDGRGVPSAAFVETVHGMAGIELTPGLSSATSCPEAIWQGARYWHGFYEKAAEFTHADDAPLQVPTGFFAIRQKAAAVTWPPDPKPSYEKSDKKTKSKK